MRALEYCFFFQKLLIVLIPRVVFSTNQMCIYPNNKLQFSLCLLRSLYHSQSSLLRYITYIFTTISHLHYKISYSHTHTHIYILGFLPPSPHDSARISKLEGPLLLISLFQCSELYFNSVYYCTY